MRRSGKNWLRACEQDFGSSAAWCVAHLAGALLGGIGWGLFAACTAGAPGDQMHFQTVIGSRLLGAAAVSAGCLLLAAALTALRRLRLPARIRALPAAGLTLAVATTSGWVVIALQSCKPSCLAHGDPGEHTLNDTTTHLMGLRDHRRTHLLYRPGEPLIDHRNAKNASLAQEFGSSAVANAQDVVAGEGHRPTAVSPRPVHAAARSLSAMSPTSRLTSDWCNAVGFSNHGSNFVGTDDFTVGPVTKRSHR